MKKIAILTCDQAPKYENDSFYLKSVFSELGLEYIPVLWDQQNIPWLNFDAVVVRSTWDYFESQKKTDSFLGTLSNIKEQGIPLFNDPDLIRWNSSKTYLREGGFLTLPTLWTQSEKITNAQDIDELISEKGWTDVVIKPSISGGSRHTLRFQQGTQVELPSFLPREDILIQPVAPEILQEGELSFIFFGDEFSHAVLKKAAPGDFRVQHTLGGSMEAYQPDGSQIEKVKKVLIKALPARPLYARMDGFFRQGAWVTMEAELIEPYLYWELAPSESPYQFTKALRALL